LRAAASVWRNYSSVEYWRVCQDISAAKALVDLLCEKEFS